MPTLATAPTQAPAAAGRIHWGGAANFLALHAATLAGMALAAPTRAALLLGAALFALRTFGLTAGYHRYFSHRSFKTSRSFQFVLAALGAAACQQGPLWWAGHHRHHHRWADQPSDVHSPRRQGFFRAHIGWVFAYENERTRLDLIGDFARFPELLWVDRQHKVPAIAMGALAFVLCGWPGVVWGFLFPTLVLYQTTFAVNSLTHTIGRRRYETPDDSRNNWWVALATFGEGWHNNHHRFPVSARQGFFWWEIDVSYWLLRMLSWIGLVWDLKEPPRTLLHPPREAA